MAIKVLLQLKGDASGATAAVDEAETALTGLGTGVDWSSLGSKLAKTAGPAIKAGLIGAALAVGDWLAEGLSDKLKTPEGAPAQASLDELTTKLDGIRDKILTPLLTLIPQVVDALLPLVAQVSNLVDVLLPPLSAALGALVDALKVVSDQIVKVLEGIGKVVDALASSVAALQTFLSDTQAAIEDALDGIGRFFADMKAGIDGLLKPIQDAIKPITDLLSGIFTKADSVQGPTNSLGQPGMQSAPSGGSSGGSSGGAAPGRAAQPAAPAWRGGVINVYTGADPAAVVRAIRRYTGDNGDSGGGLVRSLRGG